MAEAGDTPTPSIREISGPSEDEQILKSLVNVVVREEEFSIRGQVSHNSDEYAKLCSEQQKALLADGYFPKAFRAEDIEACTSKRDCYLIKSELTPEQRAQVIVKAMKDPLTTPSELEKVSANDPRNDPWTDYWAKSDQPGLLLMYGSDKDDESTEKASRKLIGIYVHDLSEIGIDWIEPINNAANRYYPGMLILSSYPPNRERQLCLLRFNIDPRIKIERPVGSFLTEKAEEQQLFFMSKDAAQPFLNTEAFPEPIKLQLRTIKQEILKLQAEYMGNKRDPILQAAVKRMHEKGVYITGVSSDSLLNIMTCGFRGGAHKFVYWTQFPESFEGITADILTTSGGAWVQLSPDQKEPQFHKDPLTGHDYLDLREIPTVFIANLQLRDKVLEGLQLLENQNVIDKGVTEYWRGKIKIPEEWGK